MSNKKPKVGINDLESQFPEIAKYWDFERNNGLQPSQVFAHSDKMVWWKCDKGHSYQMVVNNKTGKYLQGCPICSGKKVIPGINDIGTTHPSVLYLN